MADVFEEYERLGDAFGGDAYKLLNSRLYARLYIAMLRGLFEDLSQPARTDLLHDQADGMLARLEEAGFDVPTREDGARRVSGRELCSEVWLTEMRLLTRHALDTGETEYRLTSAAIAAIEAVARLGSREIVLSSPRIETIVAEINKMAAMVDPDPAARRRVLEEDLRRAQEALTRFDETGGEPASPADVRARLLNTIDLLSQVPGDMRRVEEMLLDQRNALIDDFRNDERAHGEIIAEYLQRSAAIFDGTDSGQLYNGAVEMFADERFSSQMSAKVRMIARSDALEELGRTDRRLDIKRSWDSISDGMQAILELRGRCSHTIGNAIGRYDVAKYRQLVDTLRRLETAAWDWSLANLRRHQKSPVHDTLCTADVEVLARRLHAPAEQTPPPALAPGGPVEVPAVDLRRLRLMGGPCTDRVLDALEELCRQAEPGRPVGLDDLFNRLDPELRRDVEVLGLVHHAADLGIDVRTCPRSRYRCVGPDGRERTWLAPAIALRMQDEGGLAWDGRTDERLPEQLPGQPAHTEVAR